MHQVTSTRPRNGALMASGALLKYSPSPKHITAVPYSVFMLKMVKSQTSDAVVCCRGRRVRFHNIVSCSCCDAKSASGVVHGKHPLRCSLARAVGRPAKTWRFACTFQTYRRVVCIHCCTIVQQKHPPNPNNKRSMPELKCAKNTASTVAFTKPYHNVPQQ